MTLESSDPRVLGQRLTEARKARGATQEEVANFLGCSRPTYVNTEKGERLPKPEELVKLAAFFDRQVSDLLRPSEPVTNLQPHLRAVAEKLKSKDEEQLFVGIDELQRLAEDYLELEGMLGAPLRTNYPPEEKLDARLDVAEFAESVAGGERLRLRLGEQPVYNLRSLLEWDAGLRLFYGDLPSPVAGMYASTARLGCCILINRKHPAERRRVSMLHEYGHLIVDRFKPGIDYVSVKGRKPPNERFAEAFALSFLMPADAVRQKFHHIVATTKDFQVADLCRLSHYFFVSVEAMARRLEKLGLIPKGTADNLQEERFSKKKAAQLLDLPPHAESTEPYPERYKFLAVRAFEQELISQGQLARFLRCDPVSARRVVNETLTSTDVGEEGEWRTFQLGGTERSLLAESSE